MSGATAGRRSRRRTTTRPFIAVNTVMLWVTTVIAATALWPIYRSTAVVVLVAVALAVGSLIVIVSAQFRWPSFTVLLVSVAAFLLIGVPLAVPAKTQFGVLPTAEGLLDLVTGVALGWKQLLTISLPVGDYQALLVPALVLVLVTTIVGLTVALRAKYGELAVLAPIALFIVATAFGPRFPDRPLAAPIALLVAVLFWLVWFRWYRRRAAIRTLAAQSDGPGAESGLPGLRTVIAAAVILAIASTAAVAAVGAVPPSADRTVLRTSLEQPFDPRDYVSPLSGFRSYWKPPLLDDVLLR
ncbi:MAG: transglutaminase domain-containing protein, partial [Actinobacteria bacterium]|nr:transglutaminase domain-containing protein [Actinomycetota bacterium]